MTGNGITQVKTENKCIPDSVAFETSMKSMCVSDYMIKELIPIPHDATLRQAMQRMHILDAHALVVIDSDGEILGYLTREDIVRLCMDITPLLTTFEDLYQRVFFVDSEIIGVKRLMRLLEIMDTYTLKTILYATPPKIGIVSEVDSLLSAAKIMSILNVHKLAVIDRNGKICGIITLDTVRNVLSLRSMQCPAIDELSEI
jgi:predicted transcriptional regulator